MIVAEMNPPHTSQKVFITISGQEEMPVWSPPTPPIDDDMYFDLNVCFSYSQITMAESILPPVFTKKENKRLKIETMLPGTSVIAVTRKQKVRKDDITIPRSLFDRPTAAILKMRREAKLQKVKGFMSSANFAKTIPAYASLKSTSVIVGKPPSHDSPQDHQEWLVYEDWAILQIIQNYQGLPLALTIVQPAHVPNWDMCGDAVNSLKSRLYRSPKQCKNRYESVIVPREEGKILYDANPKKPKKTKGIYKTKNNRPMRTSQLFVQDNNNSFTSLTHVRYSVIENIGKAKDRSARRWFAHAAKNQRLPPILAETGVNYEQPLYPSQIALNRAERIAREKKNQTALAAQVVEQQLVAQRQGQQTANIASANLMQHQTQAVIASLSHPHQIQNATIAALASSNLRATQRTTVTAVGTTTTMTVHEMVAAVGQVRALTTCAGSNSPATSTVVSVAGLTAVQLQAASQRLASVLPTATTTGSTLGQLTPTQRNLSQLAQYQTLRQNAILRQQREQTLKHHHLKRFQAAQHGSSHRVTSKVSANSASNNFPVSAAQQRLTQQQQAASIKQGRQMTEVEVAQLVKRQHQLQQQQKQAQLATAQILAQAQQVQQQAQLQQAQQQQASITPPLQTSVATLVKTVSAPSIGGAQSVTIPVTAAGVNINVSLPQGKPVNTQAKASTTITNQQLRQLQLQQQLILQARKGPKVTNLSQLTKVQGKGANLTTSALTNQLNTVQIIQQSGPGVGSQQTKSLQTTMTMQQIQQAMKQVMPQTIPLVSTTQGNGSGNAVNITQSQILSHTLLPTSPSTIKSGVTMPLTHSSNAAVASTTSLQTLITSSSPTARIMPVTQSTSGTTTSIPSPVIKQTIQVVSATPNLAASLQSQATVRGEPSIVSSIKPQMTTLPSATLTTSSMLKSGSAVVVGQQQTATILQQVAAPSSSGLTPQQAVTLAVRAAASQAQGQVQIQVQQSSHSSLIAQQSSQSRLSQISPGQAGINIQQNMPTVQTSTQQTSVLTNNITGIASDSLVHSPTHVVMQNAAVSNSQTNISVPAAMSPTSATAQVVQAAIQAARQQQAAQQQQVAQQQQQPLQQPKPSYTMRLRNPK